MHQEYLQSPVHRDLITHVVFLGAPSTGKTTLAQRMADEYQTVWMPEYGRVYWEKYQIQRRLSLEQLVEIAEGHLARETSLLYQAKQYLFTDTNAMTTLMFSLYYHQTAHPRLIELAERAQARYDLFFLCDTDIPYDDTWDRSGDVNRKTFQQQIVADLHARKVPFEVVSGTLEDRVARVKAVLSQLPDCKSSPDTSIEKRHTECKVS